MVQGVATCDELARELSAYLDGALAPGQAARLVRHLERCAACRARYESEKAVVERLRKVKEPPAPAELRRRIIRDLGDEDARDRDNLPEG